MKKRNRLFMPIVLGIIGAILGVALYAVDGLVFGFLIGILIGFIGQQIQTYKSDTSEPRLVPPQPEGKPVNVGMVIDFTDTKCNYCLSPENEVMYYCPQCKKPYCAKCYARSEIAGKCPIDKKKLIPIPEDKKVQLRQFKDEGPTMVRIQQRTTIRTSVE